MNATFHEMWRYREAAVKLFDIIDAIDTADDGFKENHAGFQKWVAEKARERFQWMRPTQGGQGIRLTQPSERAMAARPATTKSVDVLVGKRHE